MGVSDMSNESLVHLKQQCPDSTEEERVRFLRAFHHIGQPQDNLAAQWLQEYLDWRSAYGQSDAYNTKDDKAHWQAAWNLAITKALAGKESKSEEEKIRSEMNKLRIVIQHADDNGCPIKAKDGSLLLHILPAQINKEYGSNATYVEVLSRYADFKFSRETLEQATVLMDVRPGKGWRNHPALALLSLIRHTTHELSQLFPGRLHRILLFPIPRIVMAIWNAAKPFIHRDVVDRVVLIGGSDGLHSPPPNKELSKYVDELVLDQVEKVRLAAFLNK